MIKCNNKCSYERYRLRRSRWTLSMKGTIARDAVALDFLGKHDNINITSFRWRPSYCPFSSCFSVWKKKIGGTRQNTSSSYIEMSGYKRNDWSKSAQANAALYLIGHGRAGSLRLGERVWGSYGGWGWGGWRSCIRCQSFRLNNDDFTMVWYIEVVRFSVSMVSSFTFCCSA